ncbi:hypothetical protein DFH06DRAFT_1148798 [Mycena polygramma]|nr:hypothetical protein DFH06DRAFT_1148798 [Mycena polygramma]
MGSNWKNLTPTDLEQASPILLDEWNVINVGNTIEYLTGFCPSDIRPLPELQCRLATSVRTMVCNKAPLHASHRKIIDGIFDWVDRHANWLELDDRNASATLSEALALFARKLPSEDSRTIGRVNRCRAVLDSCSQTA